MLKLPNNFTFRQSTTLTEPILLLIKATNVKDYLILLRVAWQITNDVDSDKHSGPLESYLKDYGCESLRI